MSSFSDLMNQPLPSKKNISDEVVQESTEEMETAIIDATDECGAAVSEDIETDVNVDDIDDVEDDEIDDLSEEDLAKLDAELSDDVASVVVGDDDEDEVDLTPEEELQADDMMSVAATTMLVNDELSVEERASFLESEAGIAIDEGFMTESDKAELESALDGVVTEANNYNKKMIIRLDAASKKKQLYALAVNVSAAAHHDPDYIKLKKVMKMRKVLRAKLARKYHGEAMKRMKIYFARLKSSKSKTLNKIANKASK